MHISTNTRNMLDTMTGNKFKSVGLLPDLRYFRARDMKQWEKMTEEKVSGIELDREYFSVFLQNTSDGRLISKGKKGKKRVKEKKHSSYNPSRKISLVCPKRSTFDNMRGHINYFGSPARKQSSLLGKFKFWAKKERIGEPQGARRPKAKEDSHENSAMSTFDADEERKLHDLSLERSRSNHNQLMTEEVPQHVELIDLSCTAFQPDPSRSPYWRRRTARLLATNRKLLERYRLSAGDLDKKEEPRDVTCEENEGGESQLLKGSGTLYDSRDMVGASGGTEVSKLQEGGSSSGSESDCRSREHSSKCKPWALPPAQPQVVTNSYHEPQSAPPSVSNVPKTQQYDSPQSEPYRRPHRPSSDEDPPNAWNSRKSRCNFHSKNRKEFGKSLKSGRRQKRRRRGKRSESDIFSDMSSTSVTIVSTKDIPKDGWKSQSNEKEVLRKTEQRRCFQPSAYNSHREDPKSDKVKTVQMRHSYSPTSLRPLAQKMDQIKPRPHDTYFSSSSDHFDPDDCYKVIFQDKYGRQNVILSPYPPKLVERRPRRKFKNKELCNDQLHVPSLPSFQVEIKQPLRDRYSQSLHACQKIVYGWPVWSKPRRLNNNALKGNTSRNLATVLMQRNPDVKQMAVVPCFTKSPPNSICCFESSRSSFSQSNPSKMYKLYTSKKAERSPVKVKPSR